MIKKKMEDIKFKGARITDISRKDVKDEARQKMSSIEMLYSEREEIKPSENKHVHERELSRKLPTTPSMSRKTRPVGRIILISFIIAIILGGCYWYGYASQNARITINEKHQVITLDQEVWSSSKSGIQPINSEIMIVSSEELKDATLSESHTASTKAQGEIILYNEYSTKPQTITAGSFVSDVNGKTYKTDKTVSIPGYKTVNNAIVPGQVQVGITAFLTGNSYNGNPTDFTINSFKNTPKFKKIYGKAKTPISGGAEGLTFTLGADDKGRLDAYANSTFKNNLMKKINAQVPPEYILYPNALNYTYLVDTSVASSTSSTQVKITGTISAVLLNKEDLSKAIIKKMLPEVGVDEAKEIEINGLDELTLSFVNKNEVINKDTDVTQFKLKGTLDAVWHPDANKLKMELMGIHKTKVQEVFAKDRGILNAKVKLFPIWQSYLPTDTQKININTK